MTTPGILDNVDEKGAAVKIAVGGSGALLSQFNINEWVAILTLIYVALQIGLLLPKYWAMFHRWRKA